MPRGSVPEWQTVLPHVGVAGDGNDTTAVPRVRSTYRGEDGTAGGVVVVVVKDWEEASVGIPSSVKVDSVWAKTELTTHRFGVAIPVSIGGAAFSQNPRTELQTLSGFLSSRNTNPTFSIVCPVKFPVVLMESCPSA